MIKPQAPLSIQKGSCRLFTSAAALQWQLEQQFGPESGVGAAIPKQPASEAEVNVSRADNDTVPMDYEVVQKTGLDGEPELNLTGVTSAAPDTTTTTATSSTITSTSASSDSAGAAADLAAWAHCIDWQDLDCVLLPPAGPDNTFMDYPDHVDTGPGSMNTASKLTNLMRVDLCGSQALRVIRDNPLLTPFIQGSTLF